VGREKIGARWFSRLPLLGEKGKRKDDMKSLMKHERRGDQKS